MTLKLDELKFSQYNHKIHLEDNLYLYNALTGGFAKVSDENKELFEKCDFTSNLQLLKTINMDVVDGLLKGGMLLNKSIDEFKYMKSINNFSRFGSSNSLGLTILPTIGCNFRCSYCFEKHTDYPSENMSEEVMDLIIKLIDDKLTDYGSLGIAWFGGEPLLDFKNLEKMQLRILEKVKEKKLNATYSMVTNGYLLSKTVSDRLVELGINNVQITLDGTKECHDKKRVLKNNMGTYNKIVENILNKNENLNVSIRVNVDKENLYEMEKFFNFIIESGLNDTKNVSIYFSPVIDYENLDKCTFCTALTSKVFSKESIKINKMAYEKGIEIYNNISPNISNCGAIAVNTYVIEPDGTLQKCWNNVGDKSKSVGHLIESKKDANLSLANEIEWYSWSEYESDECKNCSVLPLCMGGCAYFSTYDNESRGKCKSIKYNLEDTLKLIAYKNINKK